MLRVRVEKFKVTAVSACVRLMNDGILLGMPGIS